MTLPSEVIEVLTKFLDDAAKILEKNLKELIQNQKSLNLNNEVFLIPSEIITDPRYLKAIDRTNPSFSKVILELLGEWQVISNAKNDNNIIENLYESNISSNFSRNISDRILHENAEKHRLLILSSPLKASPSCIPELRENLEIELIEDLKMFLSINYPPDSKECPIEFHDDYFYNAIGNSDIQQLQPILAHIPTLILHSSISDYKAYFHLGLWLPYSNYILNFTLPTWYWEESYDILVSSGIKERKSLRIIRQIIISIQELMSAFIADWYYLHLNPYYLPRLLSSEKILTSRYFDINVIAPYINIIKATQNQQIHSNKNLITLLSEQQNNDDRKLRQKIKKWSLNSVFTSHSGCVHDLAFNSDHSNLMSGGSDSFVRLWHPNTGKSILNLKGHVGDIFAVAISNNDRYLASGGSDCKVLVWSLDKLQEPISFQSHTAYVSSLAFCPDNRLLASGSYDNSIRIWDLWSNKTFRTFNEHSSYVTALSFNTTGDLLASGSYDCTIRIWNPWRIQSQITLTGHSDVITCTAFSPINDLLASGSRDCTIKLWRPETGAIISTLKGHTAGVNSLAFSPNGEILVSRSIDRTIRLWNPKTAEEIGILSVGVHPILCVNFSKDGNQLAAGSCWSDNIKIWNC
ncbi:WD40 repeat domain-containing protein [Pseudanabaena sp. FACHB-1998]|uniref:WD40 repeat domain-containing protein n=1 Tax=Pseudanabaena sp. FACHB-1998 TaxID=2692858 RepID=UPI0016817EDB|nr:WD40 repeat domain-containing protein [Pseudanabaena sp. FACHB-1998]MBD2177193.1 WD40 repeat domain-containing protein [Pseudanabaena sp. FACHB-1998]